MQAQLQKICVKSSQQVFIDLNCLQQGKKSTYDCLLVLNCKFDLHLLDAAVETASNIILADGGSNYFYHTAHRDCQRVKAIVGDLDSIKPEVQEYYRARNVEIYRAQDQDYADIEKCLNKAHEMNFKTVVCFGALGGRMDHSLNAMHLLTKFGRLHPEMQLFLIGDNNLMFYIEPNRKYKVKISPGIQSKGVGLVPFKKVEKITTTGFKWNLGEAQGLSQLEWGSFISTSNQIEGNQFTVLASDELFFVCSFKKTLN